jgi:transaldolase
MPDTYFHRLHRETPTRLWVNNPTPAEAERALALGARSATTNPTYAAKMLAQLPEAERAAIIADARRREGDAGEAVAAIQRVLIARILPAFGRFRDVARPLDGLVSIQGDPHRENDTAHILHEAARNERLGPNVIFKIPATRAGLVAIEDLLRRGMPVLATEMFSVAQTRAACDIYRRVSAKGVLPRLIVTHITGIFDEYLAGIAKAQAPDLSAADLADAGLLVARRVRAELDRQELPIALMGGGARSLRHFTDMVGGDVQVTINPDSIEALAARDEEPRRRFPEPSSATAIERLRACLPDFRRAYDEDGLAIEEFEAYGPVRHFLSMFIAGWDAVREQLKPRERARCQA